MQVRILEQIDPLLEKLTGKAREVFVASAYLGDRAVERLLQRVGTRGSGLKLVTILVGGSLGMDPAALERLYQAAGAHPERIRVRYVPHTAGALFHAKAYAFDCGESLNLIVGSGNLTAAGQFRNAEVYAHIQCPPGSTVARDFARLRTAWEAEPYSLTLTAEAVRLIQGHAEHLQQYLAYQRKQAGLEKLLSEGERLWATLTALGGGNLSLPGTEAPPLEELIREKLGAGFLFRVELPLARLHVPVTTELLAAGEALPAPEGEAVVVVENPAAYVRLLPASAIAEWEKLARDADKELRALSLPLRVGAYVPTTAQTAFGRAVQQLRARHRRLVAQHLRRAGTIREHLAERLDEEIARAWAARQSEDSSPIPKATLQAVRARVEERRKKLREEPLKAVPFEVVPSLHPVLTRSAHPGHPAWKLEEASEEQALIDALVDLLQRQMDEIVGVTRFQQQPARANGYERVRRLVAIQGKTTRRLLRLLSPWTKPIPRNLSPEDRERRNNRFTVQMDQVRREGMQHREWLEQLHFQEPGAALARLAEEYEWTS